MLSVQFVLRYKFVDCALSHCDDGQTHTQLGGVMSVQVCICGVCRLPSQVKRQLCVLLDPPNCRANDWRMLAQRLCVDRCVFALP